MPKPRSCWLRVTPISMAMAMEKPANPCAKSNQKAPPTKRGALLTKRCAYAVLALN